MKLRILYIFFLLSGSILVSAQEYSGAIGLRGGISSGITYRKFFDHEIGMETILSFRRGGMQVSLLRERFVPTLLEFSDNLILGFGFGGHVGFMYTNYQKFMFEDYYYPDKQFLPLIGIDGYFGLEYIFREVPLAISLDCKPFFEINVKGLVQLNPFDLGLAIRYWF
jgi:hypothetical protein